MGKDAELFDAARTGNIQVVEKYLNSKTRKSGPLASLRRGPGANIQDCNGYTALHHSALNGHRHIVSLLLRHEALINISDNKGSTALHLAAWAGNESIIKILLTQGPAVPNINYQNKGGDTALHFASQYGHIDVARLLCKKGADPALPNLRAETPLDLAAQFGRLAIADLLLKTEPDLLKAFTSSGVRPVFPHTPLHLASRNGHINVVKLLLNYGHQVNVRSSQGSPLHEAAMCGKVDVVRVLIEAGAEPNVKNDRGQTVLETIAQFDTKITRQITEIIKSNSCLIDFGYGRIQKKTPDEKLEKKEMEITDNLIFDDVSRKKLEALPNTALNLYLIEKNSELSAKISVDSSNNSKSIITTPKSCKKLPHGFFDQLCKTKQKSPKSSPVSSLKKLNASPVSKFTSSIKLRLRNNSHKLLLDNLESEDLDSDASSDISVPENRCFRDVKSSKIKPNESSTEYNLCSKDGKRIFESQITDKFQSLEADNSSLKFKKAKQTLSTSINHKLNKTQEFNKQVSNTSSSQSFFQYESPASPSRSFYESPVTPSRPFITPHSNSKNDNSPTTCLDSPSIPASFTETIRSLKNIGNNSDLKNDFQFNSINRTQNEKLKDFAPESDKGLISKGNEVKNAHPINSTALASDQTNSTAENSDQVNSTSLNLGQINSTTSDLNQKIDDKIINHAISRAKSEDRPMSNDSVLSYRTAISESPKLGRSISPTFSASSKSSESSYSSFSVTDTNVKNEKTNNNLPYDTLPCRQSHEVGIGCLSKNVVSTNQSDGAAKNCNLTAFTSKFEGKKKPPIITPRESKKPQIVEELMQPPYENMHKDFSPKKIDLAPEITNENVQKNDSNLRLNNFNNLTKDNLSGVKDILPSKDLPLNIPFNENVNDSNCRNDTSPDIDLSIQVNENDLDSLPIQSSYVSTNYQVPRSVTAKVESNKIEDMQRCNTLTCQKFDRANSELTSNKASVRTEISKFENTETTSNKTPPKTELLKNKLKLVFPDFSNIDLENLSPASTPPSFSPVTPDSILPSSILSDKIQVYENVLVPIKLHNIAGEENPMRTVERRPKKRGSSSVSSGTLSARSSGARAPSYSDTITKRTSSRSENGVRESDSFKFGASENLKFVELKQRRDSGSILDQSPYSKPYGANLDVSYDKTRPVLLSANVSPSGLQRTSLSVTPNSDDRLSDQEIRNSLDSTNDLLDVRNDASHQNSVQNNGEGTVRRKRKGTSSDGSMLSTRSSSTHEILDGEDYGIPGYPPRPCSASPWSSRELSDTDSKGSAAPPPKPPRRSVPLSPCPKQHYETIFFSNSDAKCTRSHSDAVEYKSLRYSGNDSHDSQAATSFDSRDEKIADGEGQKYKPMSFKPIKSKRTTTSNVYENTAEILDNVKFRHETDIGSDADVSVLKSSEVGIKQAGVGAWGEKPDEIGFLDMKLGEIGDLSSGSGLKTSLDTQTLNSSRQDIERVYYLNTQNFNERDSIMKLDDVLEGFMTKESQNSCSNLNSFDSFAKIDSSKCARDSNLTDTNRNSIGNKNEFSNDSISNKDKFSNVSKNSFFDSIGSEGKFSRDSIGHSVDYSSVAPSLNSAYPCSNYENYTGSRPKNNDVDIFDNNFENELNPAFIACPAEFSDDNWTHTDNEPELSPLPDKLDGEVSSFRKLEEELTFPNESKRKSSFSQKSDRENDKELEEIEDNYLKDSPDSVVYSSGIRKNRPNATRGFLAPISPLNFTPDHSPPSAIEARVFIEQKISEVKNDKSDNSSEGEDQSESDQSDQLECDQLDQLQWEKDLEISQNIKQFAGLYRGSSIKAISRSRDASVNDCRPITLPEPVDQSLFNPEDRNSDPTSRKPKLKDIKIPKEGCLKSVSKKSNLATCEDDEDWLKINQLLASLDHDVIPSCPVTDDVSRKSLLMTELEQEFQQRLGVSLSPSEAKVGNFFSTSPGASSDKSGQKSGSNVAEQIADNNTEKENSEFNKVQRVGVKPLAELNSKSSKVLIQDWLDSMNLSKYSNFFLERGYDNTDFLNGVMDASELEAMEIMEEGDRKQLLTAIIKLPTAFKGHSKLCDFDKSDTFQKFLEKSSSDPNILEKERLNLEKSSSNPNILEKPDLKFDEISSTHSNSFDQSSSYSTSISTSNNNTSSNSTSVAIEYITLSCESALSQKAAVSPEEKTRQYLKTSESEGTTPFPQELLTRSVDEWLESIKLSQYSSVFKKHGFDQMDKVRKIWDVELAVVLDITLEGHRKRMLASLGPRPVEPNLPAALTTRQLSSDMNKLNTDISELKEKLMEELSETTSEEKKPPENPVCTLRRSGHKKPAPPPPPKSSRLRQLGSSSPIRITPVPKLSPRGSEPSPSTSPRELKSPQAPTNLSTSNDFTTPCKAEYSPGELQLRPPAQVTGVPGVLKDNYEWKRNPASLMEKRVKYVTQYLGSCVVDTPLNGTQTTLDAISKLRQSTPPCAKIPNITLALSHSGITFIDSATERVVCEHEIHNVHCTCQDAYDPSHFAYVTKDNVTGQHYCHVFRAKSTDLSREIILTLGEAFELAYQLSRAAKKQIPTNKDRKNSNSTNQDGGKINSTNQDREKLGLTNQNREKLSSTNQNRETGLTNQDREKLKSPFNQNVDPKKCKSKSPENQSKFYVKSNNDFKSS